MSAKAADGARPGELLELTSARGLAALAVIVYHLDAYCDGVIGRFTPTHYFGPLAVDFFFALSGFVMAHVYRDAWRAGSYNHGSFLVRRFARVWPLHAACLLLVAAIVLVGARVGLAPQWDPGLSSFLSHAAMLHATGLSPEKAWNQPSWSVSAEWTAYLLFPLYLAGATLFRSAAAKLTLALAVLVALSFTLKTCLGLDLFALTTLGAIRIMPMFFFGVVLREVMALGHGREIPTRRLDLMIGGGTLAVYGAMTLECPTPMVWAGLVGMLYLLALRALKPETSILRRRTTLWLGDISYALYLVHAPVLMVVYGLGAKLFGVSSIAGMLELGVVALLLSIVAAHIGHVVVERPAQRFLVRFAGVRRVAKPVAAVD